jgi:DNA-binding winged helix-turn-helix (wHTH) protein
MVHYGLQTRGEPIRFGPFELDSVRFELRRAGRVVPIEPLTFGLLKLLASNIGRTVTRDEIFSAVWQDRIVSDAALSSQIRAVRRALGDDGKAQQMIATVHGRGFRLRRRVAAEPGTDLTATEAAEAAEGGAQSETSAGRTGPPTLVVLPCTSLDPDGRGTVLAHGMTEDIITALSKNRWLRVIPRNTTFALQRMADDPVEVARKADADYVVAGSVRPDGNRVRTTVQVTHARNMPHLERKFRSKHDRHI